MLGGILLDMDLKRPQEGETYADKTVLSKWTPSLIIYENQIQKFVRYQKKMLIPQNFLQNFL